MARIIYTALVQQIAGTMGGTTFQRNAYGYTIKNKPNMVRPNRALQNTRKITFQGIVQFWRGMSDTVRGEWITYAATYPIPSRLNPDSDLNGFNYFVRYNSYYALITGGAITDVSGPAPTTLTGVAIELEDDGGTFNVNIEATVGAGSMNALIYLTRVQGAGQVFVKNTPVLIANYAGGYPASVDVTAAYAARYGSVPEAGQSLGVRVVFVSTSRAQAVVVPTQRLEVVAA